MNSALITGGAGFLGSHLPRHLLEQGHKVTVNDDLSTGSEDNIRELYSNKNFLFVKHDIREHFDFQADYVLNFACPASPIAYQFDPVKTVETNLLGMTNVLKIAMKNNSRVIQASTNEIYEVKINNL